MWTFGNIESMEVHKTIVTLFVRHKVEDYNNWKGVYDSIGASRQEMGVTGAAVYRDAHDPSLITVTHHFNDLDAAQAFAGSDVLKTAMARAGLAGAPDIWFTDDVEQTSF